MEKSSLRFVTTLPFLVGHDENNQSAVWDFPNADYAAMIGASEERLAAMVAVFTSTRQQ